MSKTFIEAIQLTGKEREQEIIDRLKNDYLYTELLDMFRQANSWDGSFDFVDVWDISELDHMSTEDLVRAVVYGNVQNVSDPVRFNAYGNLETVSESDLESEAWDYIDELAEWLMDYWHHIYYGMNEEDEELFDAWDDIDRDPDRLEELLAELQEQEEE